MDDTSETLPKRRRATRKGAKKEAAASVAANDAAVQAILEHALEHALHPDPAFSEAEPGADQEAVVEVAMVAETKGKSGRRSSRKRKSSINAKAVVANETVADEVVVVSAMVEVPAEPAAPSAGEPDTQPVSEAVVEQVFVEQAIVEPEWAQQVGSMPDAADQPGEPPADTPYSSGDSHMSAEDHAADQPVPPEPALPPHGAPPAGTRADTHAHEPGHYWVYLAFALFVLALGFGVWGVWRTFFASADPATQNVAMLQARSDKLSQEVSTLRRSDQISREANRDLERTLADRDEEIAGLRADIAFYESFVGATGQRRGLSVHDLDMQLQGGDAWHFVATLTQNLNRGAVNSGRLTIAIEGTRNDRLERLSWSSLRKLNNAPGVEYSFKYFQQVEGELLLPPGFKPLRISVRLVPAGGNAVDQSFSWSDAVKADH